MAPLPPLRIPYERDDVFSLSNRVLSDKLQFVKEIGFGNWGSVWLCRPRRRRPSSATTNIADLNIAVKLVHRTRSDTSRARVRSLWNEMKIVTSFKDDQHPSIIPFHSFVITPSYALITMAYLPTLIPVDIDEARAKPWLRDLLSAVEFLHRRGVVHNDIKPANILLSDRRVPVFVDFGFAQQYDVKSKHAFHSNLHYGTPEYLAPERARGLPHDTRKSDIWSLGITFFEILVGRTPFEYADGDVLTTVADMERYWKRTLRGKWVGTWKISKGVEKMLRRMVAPNADLRCTAGDIMGDPYWSAPVDPVQSHTHSHKRSVSASQVVRSPSVLLDMEMSRLMDISLPWSARPKSKPASSSKNKENKENILPLPLPMPKDTKNQPEEPTSSSIFSAIGNHARSKSQPKVAASKPVQPRRRPAIPPLANLSPIKASPPATPLAPTFAARNNKENASVTSPSKAAAAAARNKPMGPRQALSPLSPNLPLPPPSDRGNKVRTRERGRAVGADLDWRGSVLRDLTSLDGRQVGDPAVVVKEKEREKTKKDKKTENEGNVSGQGQGDDSVRKRVYEWERERERLREMEALEAFEKERDEELECAKRKASEQELSFSTCSLPDQEESIQFAKVAVRASAQMVTTSPSFLDLSLEPGDIFPRTVSDTTFSGIRQSIKTSIDKGIRMYKSSTKAQVAGRAAAPGFSFSVDGVEDPAWIMEISEPAAHSREESDVFVRNGKSSLPMIRQAMLDGRVVEDTNLDRLTLWQQTVERVVDDTRLKFASASTSAAQISLPIPPISRSSSQNCTTRSSSRLPRKILAASQIFANTDLANGNGTASTSAFVTVNAPGVDKTLPALPSEGPSGASDFVAVTTPPRHRRATITSRSPEVLKTKMSLDIETGSPSKRKEKSRSQGNLLRPIQPFERLELEMQKEVLMPKTSSRLSAFLDPSLFIASPISPRDEEPAAMADTTLPRSKSLDIDHLTASPVHVEPYPPRKSDGPAVVIDSPNKRRIESVYDRFLMATSGVKRVGRGYQSDNIGPMQSALDPRASSTLGFNYNRNQNRVFNSVRRAMPPPVSSDDLNMRLDVDEFGLVTRTTPGIDTPNHRGESSNTVALVRRAFKAVVTGKTVTKRLSK